MERTIYHGRTSLISYWFLIGLGGFMVLTGIQLVNSPQAQGVGYVFVVPGLLFVVFAYLSVRATSYTVTSQRVIQRKGLLSSRTSEVKVSDIRNVLVNQTSTQRLFGIGNVAISKMGRPGTEIVFSGIRSPQEVADMIPGRRKMIPHRGLGARFTKL